MVVVIGAGHVLDGGEVHCCVGGGFGDLAGVNSAEVGDVSSFPETDV